ncbi:hypothetical protein FS749_010643 [Ceratobasidium sp. UAMH 11750]|nr:hypothetical protein FS749_010643 [Ceratobasidium sp. UAMH 11750]
MVERHRLPESTSHLRNPQCFDEEETWIWARWLRSIECAGSVLFQFRQVRPGEIQEETRTTIHAESTLQYGPESLFYTRRLMMEHGLVLGRWDGLPVMPAPVPIIMSEETLRWAKDAAAGEDALVSLVQYLSAYEHFGPYQATRADWERFQPLCKLLREELPATLAGPEHLACPVYHGAHHLAKQMFDPSLPDWSVRAVIASIDGDTFVHRSGTLMGGPYGFKWALIILLALLSAGRKIQAGQCPRYPVVVVRWLDSDTQLVVDVAKCLLEKVAESVTNLASSKADHEAARREQDLNDVSGLSWDYDEANVSVLGTGSDEWTRKNLIVTKYPAGRELAQNQRRTPPQKRSRQGMRDNDESEPGSSCDEGPPRKTGKHTESQTREAATPKRGDGRTGTEARTKGKGVAFEE